MWFCCWKQSNHGDLCVLVQTHSDKAPLQCEGLSCQCVGQHQVLYVDPVHPGPGVAKPEREQATLHIRLSERQMRDKQALLFIFTSFFGSVCVLCQHCLHLLLNLSIFFNLRTFKIKNSWANRDKGSKGRVWKQVISQWGENIAGMGQTDRAGDS